MDGTTKPCTTPSKVGMITYNIHFKGIVQGVGFRPYVYRTAIHFGVTGFVRNDLSGVLITVSGNRNHLNEFYDFLWRNIPKEANVISKHLEESDYRAYIDFRIEDSHTDTTDVDSLFMTPDFAMCDKCKQELHNPDNRRFQYPFITCTDCGPRYSIVQSLPFDRLNTSMHDFQLCKTCNDEYITPADRRFYSQTNSCKECGIHIELYDANGGIISDQNSDIIDQVSGLMNDGFIVAVKGIGGFLLLCDATNKEAIVTLRKRKHRPTKPFAVLYPNINSIENDYIVSEAEKELLVSEVAPIVLLNKRENISSIVLEAIAPKLDKIGVFLPYAPLLELILSNFGKPIIATSANVSDSNIIYENEQALSQLSTIADYILVHNRDITMPQDDSLIQLSKETNTKIVLRTGRGLSPVYFSIDNNPLDAIGYGSLLKSSICLSVNKQIYVSQYLGNTTNFDSQENYKDVGEKLRQLLMIKPKELVCDSHPNYYSTLLAEKQAEFDLIPLMKIQHHKSHFFAVLGEYQLLHERVLGVVWDGTGLGEDNHIWGGEFFVYDDYDMERENYFQYTTHILGDKMAKEPRLSALSFFKEISGTVVESFFTSTEWNLYNNILSQEKLQTSSVGRLFDAVAALLQLSLKQSYEGEAALLLENIACEYRGKHIEYYDTYEFAIIGTEITIKQMLSEIIADLCNKESVEKIALKFHFTLVRIVERIAQKNNIGKIAFSGGVFQNALLVDLLKLQLSDNYELFFHQKISPNDENISFGQIVALKCKQYLTNN